MSPFTCFFTFHPPYRSDRAILKVRGSGNVSFQASFWALSLTLLSLVGAACSAGDDDIAEIAGEAEDAAAETSIAESDDSTSADTDVEELFPDVVGVEAQRAEDGTWQFDVTLSSPYDSPERYADAWRVVGPDGTVYGERILLHDHATEQPFTRSQSGIEIPDGVVEVLVEGRDQVSGWGGETVTYALP